MYSRAEPAFTSGCGYSVCSVWQSVQLAPIEPWTEAAHASGSIVTSFDEPSLKETDEPGLAVAVEALLGARGRAQEHEGRPQEQAAAEVETFHRGPPGIGRGNGGGLLHRGHVGHEVLEVGVGDLVRGRRPA